jgi:predicted AlkP superfamily pyrophosphatase or phosphodiesterase
MTRYLSPALAACAALAAPAAAQQRPRLVVVITVDQLRPDYFERFKSQLTGGLARLAAEGAFFTNAAQDHAVTETAPGHATVLSGRWPRHTGIQRNDAGVQDSTAPLLETRGTGASPRRFQGTALFDWLKAAQPNARALSVSRKDRGAILAIGHAKEQVYWYQSGLFTTSRYYADTLPAWVRRFNAQRVPFRAVAAVWRPLLAEKDYPEPDAEPYENPEGTEKAFPHTLPADSTRAAIAYANTPWLDSLTLAFALAGLEELKLGRRGTTDLLAVSLSSTDAVGHRYGPDSRELHDQVIRLDRYLAWFLDRLTARIGRQEMLVVLTADHGVSSYPGYYRAHGRPDVHGVSIDSIVTAYNREIGARLGDTSRTAWLLFDGGMLILQDNGRLAAGRVSVDSVVGVVAARLRQVPGVARAERPVDLTQADTLQDPVARRWLHHVAPGPAADGAVVLVVTLHEPFVWGQETYAMHGAPSDVDARVPLILMGRGVRPGRYTQRAATVDIAPTLAALLGLSPFSLLDGRVLQEALDGKR